MIHQGNDNLQKGFVPKKNHQFYTKSKLLCALYCLLSDVCKSAFLLTAVGYTVLYFKQKLLDQNFKLVLLCFRGVPLLSTDDVSDNSLGSRHSVPSLSPPSPNNVSCFTLHLQFNNCTTYYTFSNYSSLSENEIRL